MPDNKNLIIFTGGGTGGSVSPLLAVYEEMQARYGQYRFAWVGTRQGIERKMVAKAGINYYAITAGKLRRYFSWRNFSDLVKIILGIFQSLILIWRLKPALVVSAGSFVSVPFVWTAAMFNIPSVIHQQDALPGLANKLMAPFAAKVTVTFEQSLKDFGKKAVWTGNPVRRSLIVDSRKSKVESHFGFENNFPVILVLGGGTGAKAINELVWSSLDELMQFCQIIHLAGKNKSDIHKSQVVSQRYFQTEFLDVDGMAEALNAADIVVSRCGMGVLSELSELGKPAILIPIPGSHQELNAKMFSDRQAAIVLSQQDLSNGKFVQTVKELVLDRSRQSLLSVNIRKVIKPNAAETIAAILAGTCG